MNLADKIFLKLARTKNQGDNDDDSKQPANFGNIIAWTAKESTCEKEKLKFLKKVFFG